ncbi:dihydropteroate synthase [Muriicola jejuensis]|uniref:Dihydropteroate synthase n=1 Tax=Muriicola jejuensis TaxID=504488 RepID=A0A6P0UFH5_9FLAO|nr:dihydropteroate synthase [Muriicola jejuensis]NER10639.1 dihydropteroate synthase [Muriicola jejuensis]
MTLNCKGHLIDLSIPKVMGVLNLTPDSFYDGGRYKDERSILVQTERMLKEGARFIDAGAYSSRPGADHIPVEEELRRIVPVVDLLTKHFPDILISIDTFRSKVAKECLGAGAALINDISAGHLDPAMMETVAKARVPYIMMHMQGTPQNMKEMNSYNDLMEDIRYYFSERLAAARALGMYDLVIDPGFGFAKNIEQNYILLRHLSLFRTFGVPVLAGLSRKSMIYKVLGISPAEALNGTTALHMVALEAGANILRAHDVKEAVECITLYQRLRDADQ